MNHKEAQAELLLKKLRTGQKILPLDFNAKPHTVTKTYPGYWCLVDLLSFVLIVPYTIIVFTLILSATGSSTDFILGQIISMIFVYSWFITIPLAVLATALEWYLFWKYSENPNLYLALTLSILLSSCVLFPVYR